MNMIIRGLDILIKKLHKLSSLELEWLETEWNVILEYIQKVSVYSAKGKKVSRPAILLSSTLVKFINLGLGTRNRMC